MSERLAHPAAEALKRWFPSLELSEVRIATEGPVSWLFSKFNRAAITLGKTIHFTRGSYYDFASPQGLALIAHELKHVEQYAREGTVWFLALYLWHWARLGFRYSEEHPLEKEAFQLQREVERQLMEESTG